jgi:hypothetical protein
MAHPYLVIPASDKTLGDRIADEALSWVGTQFRHQGRIKGRFVDCANFVALCAINIGLEGIAIPSNYGRNEDGGEMLRLLDRYMVLVPQETMRRGDLIALCDEVRREPDVPRHLIVVDEVKANTIYVIDATERGVRRHRLDGRWLRRIHSVWRLVE